VLRRADWRHLEAGEVAEAGEPAGVAAHDVVDAKISWIITTAGHGPVPVGLAR
jgi:hypothetical protein